MIKSYIDSFKDRNRALIFISDTVFLVLVVLVVGMIQANRQDSNMVKECAETGKYTAITFSGRQEIKCSVD